MHSGRSNRLVGTMRSWRNWHTHVVEVHGRKAPEVRILSIAPLQSAAVDQLAGVTRFKIETVKVRILSAALAQPAEASDLKSEQSEFESRLRHSCNRHPNEAQLNYEEIVDAALICP